MTWCYETKFQDFKDVYLSISKAEIHILKNLAISSIKYGKQS